MGWELLTRLLDSSKGRKPTLILRTQLSVRVNAILGECVQQSPNIPTLIARLVPFLSGLCETGQSRLKTECALSCPPLTSPPRARTNATTRLQWCQ